MEVSKELIKKAQQEAWYRGNLSWKFHAAQKKIDHIFKTITTQLFVGNCSRQFGKSFWAASKAVEQALKKPKSQIRYGAAFQSDLVDFIIPAFEKVLDDCPEAIKGVYKKAGSKFVFPNGSIIKLVGLDKNPNGLRGNTLDLIIIDECGFVSRLDYIYKSVIIPATTHRPNCKIVLISTPPSTPAHEFVEYAQRAETEGGYKLFTIFDNPMVDATVVHRLMKETGCTFPCSMEDAVIAIDVMIKSGTLEFPPEWNISTTFRREYLCEFILDNNSALVTEWKDSMIQVAPKDEYFGYYHKYVGMDLGRKDFTALVFGYYDFKAAKLYIQDELTMEGKTWTTITLKDAILDKEKDLWGADDKPFRRISDNNNPHLIMDLNSLHNVHFLETSKESLEAMVNEVRLLVGEGRVVIDPKCTKTIGCLKYGIWTEKRDSFAHSKVYGHFDHFAALMYLIRNLAKHSNPIPVTHGHANHTSWLGNVKNKTGSHNARALQNALLPKKRGV